MLSRRVLIIEDDADAAGVLEAYLRRENYDVVITGDGLSGLDMAHRWKPDLILLDVMLPGLNGTEVLAGLRRKNDVPVIMVTAMGDTPDRIGALRYGADDYIVKPYHPGEVVARVQAVLRRSNKKETKEEILRWQSLEVDVTAIVASIVDGNNTPRTLDLTPTEFSLLTTLMRSPSRPFSRQHLLEHCLPESEALERVVDTHIYNLRKKLEAAGISGVLVNVRGVGYRFRQPITSNFAMTARGYPPSSCRKCSTVLAGRSSRVPATPEAAVSVYPSLARSVRLMEAVSARRYLKPADSQSQFCYPQRRLRWKIAALDNTLTKRRIFLD